MDCKKVETFLLDHYYKELSPENAGTVESHLYTCLRCQTLYDRMTAVMDADLVQADVKVNEFISTRIMARLENQSYAAARVRWVQYVLRPVIVVSLVVLGIFTGIRLSNTFSENTLNDLQANDGNATLVTQYASENYLTSVNDEYIELYLNDKK